MGESLQLIEWRYPARKVVLLAFFCSLFYQLLHAQRFPHSSVDIEDLELSDPCILALNSTIQCDDSLLQRVDLEIDFVSSAALQSVCGGPLNGTTWSNSTNITIPATPCRQSLEQVRQSVAESCTASDLIEINLGEWYSPTYLIDRLILQYQKVCRSDLVSNQYCENVLNSWSELESLSANQECSDCLLGLQQIDLNHPLGWSEEAEVGFKSTTSSCGKGGYSYNVPSTYPVVLSSATATETISATPCQATHAVQAGDDCNSIALMKSVSTFSLIYENGLHAYCETELELGRSLCIPRSCDLYEVEEGDTCRDIVGKVSNDITLTQLLAWNYNINALCSNLENFVGTHLCISPPGQTLNSGPDNNMPDPSNITESVEIPSNIHNGTSTHCGKYYTAQPGDYCALLTVQFGISLQDFYFLNPPIDRNCSNLIAGWAYCIKPVGDLASYPDYPGGTPTADPCDLPFGPSSCYETDMATLPYVPFSELTFTWEPYTGLLTTTTPYPTASGAPSDCALYRQYRVETDTAEASRVNACSFIARHHQLPISELISLNPPLSGATPCIISPSTRYCVYRGSPTTISSPATTTTEAYCDSTPNPSLTVSGSHEDCHCWEYISLVDQESGFGCDDIANDNKISRDSLLSLNPWLGADCSGLYSGLTDNHYQRQLCVRAGAENTPTTTSGPTTTATLQPPGPVQEGISEYCIAYHVARSGDSCSAIQQEFSISFEQLYAWNPALGSNCGSLWPGFAYCIDGPQVVQTTSTSTTTTSTTTGNAPGPTQTGIPSNCISWIIAQSDDSCWAISNSNGISLAKLYELNPALNVGGECWGLWPTYAYCIGVADTTPTAPGPTQSGIASSCNAWVLAQSDDTCWGISNANSITLARLYELNPALNVGGECWGLWPAYAYCIGTTV